MMFSVNTEKWATETFSDAELGDLRGTKRLAKRECPEFCVTV